MTADPDAPDDIDLIELGRAAGRMGRLLTEAGLTAADDAGLIELGRVAHRVAETGGAQLTDPRLRAVWRELMRRNRKNGQFLHAAKFDVGCGTPDERQQSAISMLLTAACKHPRLLMTRHERDALRDDLHNAAATLRTLVDRMQRLGLRPLHNVPHFPLVDPLIVAADEAETTARDLDRRVRLIDRDRGMPFERGMAMHLTYWCQLLFGKPMYGVVANLIEVVTEHNVARHRIRDWCADPDAKE
jgi:hypothetical protein